MKGFPDDVKVSAVAEMAAGATAESVASKVGCSTRTIRHWTKAAGLSGLHRGRPSKWRKDKAFMALAQRQWPDEVDALDIKGSRRTQAMGRLLQRWIGYCAALGSDR